MADSSERPGLFRRLLGGSAGEEKVRTARFPLQAYGKLPIYKDFISIGLTDAGAREFRQWLDRGFSYRWAENEEYRDTEIPAHGFLLRLPESKNCMAGALWGSSDEGGLRKFPFAVFLSFPAAQPAADPVAAVHYLAAIERRCEEIRDGYAAGASLSAFYKAYRGAEFECALKTREQAGKELKSAIGDFAVSDFAESLFGARAAARWPGFLAAFEDAACRANGPSAIRLPLGGVLPRSREIAVWLRWLDRLDAKRRRPVTGVLYTSGRGPGRAVLFFRDLAPEDFLLLHPTQRGHAQVLEIDTPEEPSSFAGASSFAKASEDKVEDTPEDTSEGKPAAAVPVPAPPAVEAWPSTPAAPAPEIPAAGELPAEPATSEPLPFPEAHASETGPEFGPRETFSSLVVPVAEPPAGIASPPAAADSAPAPLPGPPPGEPPPAPPAGWNRPLYALLGL
jgi:type VI secretion system ImpM family protein